VSGLRDLKAWLLASRGDFQNSSIQSAWLPHSATSELLSPDSCLLGSRFFEVWTRRPADQFFWRGGVLCHEQPIEYGGERCAYKK
jgi:hypothetical protein